MTEFNYKVRVLTPKVEVENVEALKENRPFIMKADLELGARFIQAVALPTLVDMLGFSGGGGAPAYGFLVETRAVEKEPVLFISLAPNSPVLFPEGPFEREEDLVRWEPLGLALSLGAVLAHFILRGPGVAGIAERAAEDGAVVVGMTDYQIPDMLKQKILPQRLAQMKSSG